MVELQIVVLAVEGSSPVGHPFCSARSHGSAHAAVGSPGYLGHLAGDDVRLEAPATNTSCAFSLDDVMTRRQGNLEATLAICREALDDGITRFDLERNV